MKATKQSSKTSTRIVLKGSEISREVAALQSEEAEARGRLGQIQDDLAVARQARINVEIQRNKPVQVSREEFDRATGLLAAMMFGLEAINKLAVEAIHSPDDDPSAQWLLAGIQDVAKMNARRVEIVHAILTGDGWGSFGNFSEEFDIPERRKA